MQALFFLQVVSVLLPVTEANPIPTCGNLLLNELAIDYGEHSFIELYATEDMTEERFKDLFYGLIIIQPNSGKRRAKVRAIIDLHQLKQPKAGARYFVFGNPKEDLITVSEDDYFGTPLAADVTHIKLYDESKTWLDIGEKGTVMIILTCSLMNTIASIKSDWSQTSVFLDKESDLVNYIDRHQVDSIIVRGVKGPRQCKLLQDYVPSGIRTMHSFVTVIKAVSETTNKCGTTDNPYVMSAYKEGVASPGSENNCDGNRFAIGNALAKFTKLQPSTVNNLEESCSVLDEDDFSSITPEQLNADAITSAIVQARGSGPSTCRPRDEMDYDNAQVLNDIQRLETKRSKVVKPWSDMCPGESQNPLVRQRMRHNEEAKKFISGDAELSKKIDSTLIAGKHWFQLLRDFAEPSNSRFNCFYCSKYSKEFRLKNTNRLATPEGIMDSKKRNHALITEHESKKSHKIVMQNYRKKYLRELPDTIQGEIMRAERPEFHITNKHIR